MAILFKSLAVTATATAAPLSATDLWVANFSVQNVDAANTVFIGDASVTSASGYKVVKDGALGVDALMAPTHVGNRRINLKHVYAVCSSGQTAALRVGYVMNEDG